MGNENSNQGTAVGSTIGGGTVNAKNIAGRDINIYTERAPHTPPPNPPPQGKLPTHGRFPPNSRMTLERNPHFVGREEELHQLAAALLYASDGEAQAITTHGIGGMGKSQLAVEYASRYGRFYAGGVYWVSFADGDSVAGEIAACGTQTAVNPAAFAALPLPQQAVQTMNGWGDGKQRLLIFDNCEEPALYKKWRPQKSGCRILLTSRRATWNSHLAHTIKLDKLTRPQSIVLLQHLTKTAVVDPHLDGIADTVGDLPLALHLAGNYLHEYNRTETPETYLNSLQEQLLDHASMHGRGSDDSPTDHALSLTVTIAMSAAKLDTGAIDQLVAKLLAYLAYLAPGEPITRTLLLEFANVQEPLDGDDAIARLLALGLLETEAGGAVKLHRTIAAYVRAEWGNDGVQAALEQAVITKAYTDNMSGFPARLATWLPHLRHVTNTALTGDEQASALATNLGYHLRAIGDYAGAKSLFEKSLAISEEQLGSDHPDTATHLNNLAALLKSMGQYGEAQPLFERTLAIKEKQLGPEHPDTAGSLNNLVHAGGSSHDV